MFAGVLLFVFACAILSALNKLHIQPYSCTCKQLKKTRREDGTIPQEKSPKLPARRNISSSWPCGRTRSARQKSTAFMRCAIIGHHTDGTGRHAACPTKPAIARRTASPGAKGLPSPGAESGRRPQSAALCHAAGRRSAQRKGRNGERFLRLSDGMVSAKATERRF